MAGASLTYWLWWAGSVGVGIVLLAVGLWAVYAGRPRGRVCPRCHYSLAHIESLRCPECGFEANRRGQLRARIRHPWLAVICLMLINAGVALVVYRQFFSSWTAMLPDRVLIMMLPVAGGPDGFVWHEVERRILTDSFSIADQRALIARCVSGDYGARPIEPTWRERYGALLRVWRDSKPPEELTPLLFELPVAIELVTREQWPLNTEVCVQARVEDWWPAGTEIKLTATPSVAAARPETFVRTGYYLPVSRFAMFLPAMTEGEHAIDYAVSIERRNITRKEKWVSAGEQRHRVEVRVQGTMDGQLPAAHDPVLDEMIAKLFSIGIARWDSGVSPVRVYFEPEQTFVPEFEGVAIGVAVRVLHEGVVVRSMNLWWLGGSQTTSPLDWNLGWEVPWEDLETLMNAPADDGLWSVQVVALQEVALRVLGAKRYWDGEVTVPTTVIKRQGEAPPVPWRRANEE